MAASPARSHDTWRAATTTTEFRETGLTRGAARPLLPQGRAEHFLHEPSSAAARGIARPLGVAPAVGPDRVRHTPEGHQALVVPLLVAVVDRAAGKQAVAVVLVRALGGRRGRPAAGGTIPPECRCRRGSLSGRSCRACSR